MGWLMPKHGRKNRSLLWTRLKKKKLLLLLWNFSPPGISLQTRKDVLMAVIFSCSVSTISWDWIRSAKQSLWNMILNITWMLFFLDWFIHVSFTQDLNSVLTKIHINLLNNPILNCIRFTGHFLFSQKNPITYRAACLKTVWNFPKERLVSFITTAQTSILRLNRLRMINNTACQKKTVRFRLWKWGFSWMPKESRLLFPSIREIRMNSFPWSHWKRNFSQTLTSPNLLFVQMPDYPPLPTGSSMMISRETELLSPHNPSRNWKNFWKHGHWIPKAGCSQAKFRNPGKNQNCIRWQN